jgi:signal transduction histidine kinase
LLILIMGMFVWAWLPALIGVAVIAAFDDWRRAIPAWAAAVAVGVLYCLSGINALILGGPVNIRLRYTALGTGGPGDLDLALTGTYLALYVLGPTVAVLVAAAVGMIRGARRERSGATVALQDALATESVASERARVARDLHDVVAHHISLVAVRAESAPFVQPGLDEPARTVLAEIADDARRALDELRQVLTVLERSSGDRAERAPQPGAGDVATLIGQANAAGQQVTSTGDWGQVPGALGYVLYRVVQEALSNARRHAPGRPVEVACSSGSDMVTVTVSNPVDERYQPGPAGRGLIGMRERVNVLGGTLDTRLTGGKFVVSATLPRTGIGRPQ